VFPLVVSFVIFLAPVTECLLNTLADMTSWRCHEMSMEMSIFVMTTWH